MPGGLLYMDWMGLGTGVLVGFCGSVGWAWIQKRMVLGRGLRCSIRKSCGLRGDGRGVVVAGTCWHVCIFSIGVEGSAFIRRC